MGWHEAVLQAGTKRGIKEPKWMSGAQNEFSLWGLQSVRGAVCEGFNLWGLQSRRVQSVRVSVYVEFSLCGVQSVWGLVCVGFSLCRVQSGRGAVY